MTTVLYWYLHPNELDNHVNFLYETWIPSLGSAIFVYFVVFGLPIISYALTVVLFPETSRKIKNSICKLFVFILISSLVGIMIIFLGSTLPFVLELSIPYRTAGVCQVVILIMKLVSFVTETIISNKSDNSIEEPTKVNTSGETSRSLKHFLYFLLAPTMIYRNDYPRINGKIRWKFVLINFFQFLYCAYAVICMMEFFVEPTFIGCRIRVEDIPWIITQSYISGLVIVVFVGIGVLHCCTNIQAEVMSFADRCFYKEYWTSTNPLTLMTSWNVFIQDWIFEYPYQFLSLKVIGSFITPSSQWNKFISSIVIFAGSAFVHDYATAVIFGFYSPVFLITFGLAASVQLIAFQVFQSLGLTTGRDFSGRLVTQTSVLTFWSAWIIFFSLEYFSRIQCTLNVTTSNIFSKELLINLFIPRSFSCVTLVS